MSSRTRILEPLQRRLLKVLLKVAIPAAIPALATGIYASVRSEAYLIVAIDVGAYLGMCYAFFILRKNYHRAAMIFVYSVQVLAVFLVLTVGTEGASVLWLAAAVMTATLLLKTGHTIVVFAVNFATLAVTTWLLHLNYLSWYIPLHGWYAVLGSYLGISIFLSAGVRFLLHHLSDGVFREQLLNREIQHRVRNNLQLVESLMSIEAEAAEHAETATTLQLMMDRVSAISHAFDSMESDGSVLEISTTTLLSALTGDQQRHGRPVVAIETEAMPEKISLDVAVPLAVVVAELFYHFNTPDSRLRFRAVRTTDRLELELHDRRTDAPRSNARTCVIPPVQQQIMEALVSQFGGKLTVAVSETSLATIQYPTEATGA